MYCDRRLVMGAIDEIHQSFVPGRFSSIFDWFADLLGGVIGTLAGRWIIMMVGKS